MRDMHAVPTDAPHDPRELINKDVPTSNVMHDTLMIPVFVLTDGPQRGNAG